MKGKNRLLFSFLILTPILIMCNGCSPTQTDVFLVTWKNYDGNILKEEKYNYGEMPSYKGAVPTKPDTTEHSYTFSSWSPTLEKVTCNKVYTANFDETARKYEIKWYNGATCLETDEVEYGIVPKYKGLTPQRSSDPQYDYSFSGWSPIVTKVTGPVNYYAQFSTATRSYQIIWQDDEGKELKKETLPYGTTPKYDGIPIKQSTAQYSYTFSGWSPSISTVTGPTIYKATFSPTIRSYDIVFKNGDKVLQSERLEYGTTPTYKGDTPIKESSAQYDYTFTGWSPSVTTVTGPATYVATFSSMVRCYDIKWYNGSTLLKTDFLEYGTMPIYKGATPTKESTDKYDYVFSGWSPSVTIVTGSATYTAVFDSYINSSWEEIASGKKDYQVGDMKKIEVNNQIHRVRIIGKKHDEIIDEKGEETGIKANYTFEFINLLSDSSGYSLATLWNTDKGISSTNYDYLNSDIRKALDGKGSGTLRWYQKESGIKSTTYNTSVYEMLPSGLKSQIKTVNKKVATSTSYALTNYDARVFVLTNSEITQYGSAYAKKEGTTYQYYKNHDHYSSRIKHQIKWHTGAATNSTKIIDDDITWTAYSYAGYNHFEQSYGGEYWLTSPDYWHNGNVCTVQVDGLEYNNYVFQHALAVAPAFCI